MTPRTRTEPRSTPLRSPHQAVGLFLGAAVLAVLIVAPSLAPATFIPRVAIDNPTPFDVNVDVSGGGAAVGSNWGRSPGRRRAFWRRSPTPARRGCSASPTPVSTGAS